EPAEPLVDADDDGCPGSRVEMQRGRRGQDRSEDGLHVGANARASGYRSPEASLEVRLSGASPRAVSGVRRWTRPSETGPKTAGLRAVERAPLLAEHAADLADRRVRGEGVPDRREHVRGPARRLAHRRERAVGRGRIPPGPNRPRPLDLPPLGLRVDAME